MRVITIMVAVLIALTGCAPQQTVLPHKPKLTQNEQEFIWATVPITDFVKKTSQVHTCGIRSIQWEGDAVGKEAGIIDFFAEQQWHVPYIKDLPPGGRRSYIFVMGDFSKQVASGHFVTPAICSSLEADVSQMDLLDGYAERGGWTGQ